MKNDFIEFKKKYAKIEEDISHYDPDPARKTNGQFTFKNGSNVVDATIVKETKKGTANTTNDSKAALAKGSVGVLNGVKVISTESAKLFDKEKKENKFYKKYPDIDDKELNAKLNRLRMEQQYSDLNGDTKVVKTGAEKARDVLNTIGNIAGIASGIALVISVISQTRTGQKPSGK